MTDSDRPSLMTRRRSLKIFGSAGVGVLLAGGAARAARAAVHDGHDYVADAARACTLTAEQEVGPFYVAVDRVRSDVVLGQAGLPLNLTITIINSTTCKPLRNVAVDLWQCNGSGVYSDESSENTSGARWLRGVQFTDTHGQVQFRTIFPGHYAGRTTHIHAKVHTGSSDHSSRLTGGHVAHVGQMFPSQAAYEEVYTLSPYNAEAAAIVTHAEDRVWTQQHGPESVITVTKVGNQLSKGLDGTITLAVNPSATPAPV